MTTPSKTDIVDDDHLVKAGLIPPLISGSTATKLSNISLPLLLTLANVSFLNHAFISW